jgi:hypothetical protein
MTLSDELRRARLAGDNPDPAYVYGLIDRALNALVAIEADQCSACRAKAALSARGGRDV